jgi:hypothetical protein
MKAKKMLPRVRPGPATGVAPRLCGLPRIRLRNCPKRVGRAYSVAPRATEKGLFGPFAPRIPAKFTLRALLESLFGQFLAEVR